MGLTWNKLCKCLGVTQFASATIHHDILWPIREKLCQNWQHRKSNSNRADLQEDPLMVYSVHSGNEVDLNNSSLPPSLQNTIVTCVAHTEDITSAKTFPISELCGWKRTSPFHKPTADAQIPCAVLVLWKLVCMWPLRRKVGPFQLGWH